MKIRNIGIAAAIIFCLTCFTSTALAQLSVSITVKNPDPYNGNQSWFIYEEKPGDTISDVASIKNYGTEPVNIHVCAIDGTTNVSGSFVLKFDFEKQVGIGSWTDVPKKELTIKPGERIDIPFKITIPKDAQPGQYLGGIIIENNELHLIHNAAGGTASNQESKGNTSYGKAVVATRIGARIYLTIPGEVTEKVNVDDFTFVPIINNKSFFKFKITNTGNVAFAPTANIKIFDQLGNLYDEIEKPLGASAPSTTIEPIVLWDKRPILGQFTATADVTFKRLFEPAGGLHGAPISFSTSTKFLILPWVSLILFFLMFAITTTYAIHRKCRADTIIRTAKKYQVTNNDDLMSIAKDTNIPWKVIAKINRLKAPYSIKPGQTIIIPSYKNTNEKK